MTGEQDTSTPRRRPFQFTIGCLLGVTCIIGVLCGGVVYVNNKFVRPLRGRVGPVTARSDWPIELESLVAKGELTSSDVDGIWVHCLTDFIDEEFIWRMNAAPGLISSMDEHWDLSEVQKSEVPLQFWKMKPSWWTVDEVESADFFASKSFLDRTDGPQVVVMHDRSRDVLFVWYNFIF